MGTSTSPDPENQLWGIALPEVTQHAIMNYPLPDHQTGRKYSPFTYLHTDSARNLCGTVNNVASPEMLYCSSSSGGHFDRRARELRQSPSVVEGIIDSTSPCRSSATRSAASDLTPCNCPNRGLTE